MRAFEGIALAGRGLQSLGLLSLDRYPHHAHKFTGFGVGGALRNSEKSAFLRDSKPLFL